MSPKFVMLKGTVCPVLARYRKFMWASRDIVEVASIIVQVGNDIQTYSRELPLLLEPKDVFQLTLKNLKKKYELDDEFYPTKEMVELALRDGLEDIKYYKYVISAYRQTMCRTNIKWKKYEEIRKFIDSSPRDYIELVKK